MFWHELNLLIALDLDLESRSILDIPLVQILDVFWLQARKRISIPNL